MIDSRLEKIEEYIRTHHTDPTLSVSRLATFVSMSQTQLREIVFRDRHTHPRDLVESYRLARACELLCSSNLDINEISHLVGYWNTKTFREAFRKRFTKCPHEYRTDQCPSKANEKHR